MLLHIVSSMSTALILFLDRSCWISPTSGGQSTTLAFSPVPRKLHFTLINPLLRHNRKTNLPRIWDQLNKLIPHLRQQETSNSGNVRYAATEIRLA